MSVQQLREHITSTLERYFPDVPVYVEGEKPQIAYFHPGLISATLDRQREGRYLAVYRFGIRYEQGNLLEAERMADKISEAMSGMEQDGGAFRVVRQAWEAGPEGHGPLFTVDYMLYLQNDKPDSIKMGQMIGGERLK
ncbi:MULTISPECIES: DUF6838 family protein [unclassified Paenibacillus]|uniref:phage tail terminator family protein n=1 Tax=unclassified Paenibacillus TaxID=185978 RepID=UPI0024746172|nr:MULTISPECIES: hypothetical protein [unclassified Paenibacillus]MDH6430488.1 hypothetical protein [Paenibacillus sp. PastH-4]MDH6447083.1 hypothetical protein [Paenibacillus sp. PastF-4]MDH6530880.1 hypothetical protein [Paenibacillus sp. PastH-3]